MAKKPNAKMVIYFSEQDLQDLINGEQFQWTFPTDRGEDIDVLLRGETQDDLEDVDEADEFAITDIGGNGVDF